MTPRPLDSEHVRAGDRIRWEYPAYGVAIEGIALRNGEVHVRHYGSADAGWDNLTLLDRPLPPIPTDEGTVIRFRGGGVYTRSSGRWKFGPGAEQFLDETTTAVTREHFDVLVPEQVDQ